MINLRERQYILGIKQIMGTSQEDTLEKIFKFIRDINKYFVLLTVPQPCLYCIYCTNKLI